MFSKMLSGLRAEAEKVNGANCLMMVNSHTSGWDLLKRADNMSPKFKAGTIGVIAGGGGTLGLMTLAASNQAAGMVAMYSGYTAAQTAVLTSAGLLTSAGTVTTMLATVSSVMAGLGTIAIGSAVFPVATVVAAGSAVVGAIALFASNNLTGEGNRSSRYNDLLKAIETGDKTRMLEISKEKLSVADWLKGAKNFVNKSISGAEHNSRVKNPEEPTSQSRIKMRN